MSNEITLSIGNFETVQVKPDGRIATLQEGALKRLFERGWELISRKKANGREVVVLRRPGK